MNIADDLVAAFNDGVATAQAKMADKFAELRKAIVDTGAAYEKAVRDLKDCRNELCLRCGDYKMAHRGACDGCRWRNVG